MKYLALVLVVIIFGTPRSAQNKTAKDVRQDAKPNQNQPQASMPTAIEPNATKGNQKKASSETTEGIPHRVIFPTPVPIKSDKDPWDKALVIFTAALVLVAAFQIMLLWRTVQATSENAKAAQAQATHSEAAAKSAAENAEAANANARAVEAQSTTLRETLEAIKRQADIMEQQVVVMQRSIELQEVGLRQWVNLTSWNVERVEGQKALFVHFKIENPTDIPLTLDAALLQLDDDKHDGLNVSGTLTPENPREVTTGILLTDEKLSSFEESSLSIIAQCSVMFRDNLNRYWQQIFVRMILCGPAKTEVIDIRNRMVRSAPPTIEQK